MEEKKISLMTLCDLSKALDSVNHEILMEKLAKVETDPFWFRHYLYQTKIRLSKLTTPCPKQRL